MNSITSLAFLAAVANALPHVPFVASGTAPSFASGTAPSIASGTAISPSGTAVYATGTAVPPAAIFSWWSVAAGSGPSASVFAQGFATNTPIPPQSWTGLPNKGATPVSVLPVGAGEPGAPVPVGTGTGLPGTAVSSIIGTGLPGTAVSSIIGAGTGIPTLPPSPASTSEPQAPSSVIAANPNRATHRVIAGFNGGLQFEPENIVAAVGDLVEVHFNPKNHSFAQSSFENPCMPIGDDAIFSGFMPTMDGEAPNVFTIEIEDQLPKWFYCAQTKDSHCQAGMSMVVNQDFSGPNTLNAYKAKAALTGVSVAPSRVQGGTIAPPPNGPGL